MATLGNVDEVWLLPHGYDYRAATNVVTALQRALCTSVAVEFGVDVAVAVKSAPLRCGVLETAEGLRRLLRCELAGSYVTLLLRGSAAGGAPICNARLREVASEHRSVQRVLVAATAARGGAGAVFDAPIGDDAVFLEGSGVRGTGADILRTVSRWPVVAGRIQDAILHLQMCVQLAGRARIAAGAPYAPAALHLSRLDSRLDPARSGSSARGAGGAGASQEWGAGAEGGSCDVPAAEAALAGLLSPAVLRFAARYGMYGLGGAHADARHVAVLGGSFNPITDAHVQLAADVLASKEVGEVWVVPCGPRPDKPSLATPSMQRYLMCILAVEATLPAAARCRVTASEVFDVQAQPSYTLLSSFARLWPEQTFSLVIGSDLLPTLHKWQYADELCRECRFIVVNRPGPYEPVTRDRLPRMAKVLRGDGMSLFTLSSTLVRQRLAHVRVRDAGWALRAEVLAPLLPAPVLRHILRHGLFTPAVLRRPPTAA